ncbi:MAG: tetratricopeptide repeat protein [Flavobacteriales bacterium]|nr:tetratricopeptide repeat protein [Flavobacteriales bacterium]
MKKSIYVIATLFLVACGPKEEQKATPVDATQTEATVTEIEEDSVLTAINAKIRNDINNKDLYLERCNYYLDREELEPAVSDMNRAFQIDTAYLPTLLRQADYLTKRGKLELGKSILEKADKLHPENSKVHIGYSKLYLIARNNEKSMIHSDLAVKYDLYNAEAYYLKGYNFLELGDTTKAISSYRTAVEQDPEHFPAFLELGLIFSEQGDLLALEYFRNALELRPNERRVLYSKGMFEQENEMYNEAMLSYTQAIKAHPDFKEAHYNLGYVHLFYLKLYRQSQKYFTDAIAVDPNYIQAYYNRGYAFELLGDIGNAAKDYRKALEIDPSYDYAAQGLSRLN